VLDVSGPLEILPSQLTNPNRLMIELRAAATSAVPVEMPIAPVVRPAAPPAATELPKSAEQKPKPPVEPVSDRFPPAPEPPREIVRPAPVRTEAPSLPLREPAELARAARPTSGGSSSL